MQEKIGEQTIHNMFNAQKLGEKLFGLNIPFVVDGKPAKHITEKLAAYVETLAEYDFRNDIVRIYKKRLNYFSKSLGIDLNLLIRFVICHEVGHAKEGRLCEKSGFYPYTIKVSPAPIPFSIESITYDLRKVQVSGIGFPETFLNGISDCVVNKELLKNSLFDPLAKKTFIRDIAESAYANLGQNQMHQIIIEKSCMLPLNVDFYLHRNLDARLKRLIETDYRQLLGEKWDYTVSKMEQLEITEPLKNVEIAKDLLEKVLGICAFSLELDRYSVFDFSRIPKFWSKDRYNVLFVC